MGSYWVVRAGDDIQDVVEERSLIGIGWPDVGDCSGLSREEVAQRVSEASSDDSSAQSRAKAVGQVYRFASEISEGDIVLTPIKSVRQVLIGRVTGAYVHNPKPELHHLSNTRSAEWLCTNVYRDNLSLPLKNSLGGLMTVFSVDIHMEEIDQLIEEGPQPPGAQIEDAVAHYDEETDAEYAEDIEANAKERIRDMIYASFDGYDFQGVVADVLTAMGFTARRQGRGPDKGVDIVVTPDALGFEEPRIKVQAKRQRGKASRPDVQQLAGTLHPGEKGLFVSLGGFTSEALGESSPTLSLLDGDDFIDLLIAHYENLSPNMKTQIPLKRVYLPVG